MHVMRGEELLRNANYLCLKFLVVKMDPLNDVSHNTTCYTNVTTTINKDLLYHISSLTSYMLDTMNARSNSLYVPAFLFCFVLYRCRPWVRPVSRLSLTRNVKNWKFNYSTNLSCQKAQTLKSGNHYPMCCILCPLEECFVYELLGSMLHTTYRKYKESAHMCLIDHPISQPSLDVSSIWTLVITAKSKNYDSDLCRLSGQVSVFLCWFHAENLSLQWWLLFW
jgi:hypothetical protein